MSNRVRSCVGSEDDLVDKQRKCTAQRSVGWSDGVGGRRTEDVQLSDCNRELSNGLRWVKRGDKARFPQPGARSPLAELRRMAEDNRTSPGSREAGSTSGRTVSATPSDSHSAAGWLKAGRVLVACGICPGEAKIGNGPVESVGPRTMQGVRAHGFSKALAGGWRPPTRWIFAQLYYAIDST